MTHLVLQLLSEKSRRKKVEAVTALVLACWLTQKFYKSALAEQSETNKTLISSAVNSITANFTEFLHGFFHFSGSFPKN
ncbi:MAG: hypothetical protein AAF609_17135 [Cyanobacteria bacterium P01_C01_bin.120]